jgi:colicin import membrane protein
MENSGDKTRAVLYALLVHLIGFTLLVFGLLWTQKVQPISIPGAVIEATLVGPVSAPKPQAAAKPKPAPPKPEPPAPKPPEPQPPAPPQRNDAIEREKIAEIAQLKAEQAERAQEEKHHVEQIRLEDEQKREAAERERQKQLDDIKKQREAAQKKLKLEQDKLAQLNDLQKQQTRPVKPAPAQLPDSDQPRTGMAGQDDSLSAQYYAAIQNAVTQNWLRPDNAPPGLRCTLRIVQIPGGDVLSVDIASPCNADPQTRTSIEQAVKRAAPLPYKGYEKVFQRSINFNFSYDG